ncbi:dihydropteroate synthase [Leucothrix sargassi]|nr:dihydropteroate synthase [Leucothrix sargassi]
MSAAIYQSKQTPLIMGILNVTPDSFSDGGRYNDPDKAVAHALHMVEQGADIIDVGGESTRPGAETVDTQEQLRRVIPVIQLLRQKLPNDFPLSIDTTDADVAKAAVEAGVNWLNDISAAEDSPEMLDLAAAKNLPIVLMHRQGVSATMQDNPSYEDVCGEVFSYLEDRAAVAIKAGVTPENIVLDPGIGFGKRFEDNLQLLKGIDQLCELPYPVLLGTSRKRMLMTICDRQKEELAVATAATTALAVRSGVRILRVHDVLENRQAADVAWVIHSV